MADQFDHLRNATDLLRGDRDLRAVIPAACDEFWQAVFDLDIWPDQLREKANGIVEQVLQHGTIHATLPRLDDDALRKIAHDIQQLAAEVDACLHRPPPSAEEFDHR